MGVGAMTTTPATDEAALELLPDAVIWVDADACVHGANEAARLLFGAEAAVVGASVADLLRGTPAAAVLDHLELDGRVHEAALDITWPTVGHERHFEVRMKAGQLGGSAAELIVIRDQTQPERRRRELEALVDGAFEGIALYDDEERLATTNDAWATVWGEAGSAPTLLAFIEAATALAAPEARQRLAEGLADLRAGRPLEAHELALADGGLLRLRGVPLGHAEMLFVVDLSTERRTQALLAAKAHEWQRILQHLAEGVVVVDAHGKPIASNPAAERLLGVFLGPELDAGELAQLLDIRDGDGAPIHGADFPVMRMLANRRAEVGHLLEFSRPDPRSVMLGATPLEHDDGSLLGGVVVFQDVTELQQVSRQLEQKNVELANLNEQRVRFYSNMSHELRSPLQGIVGYTQLLQLDLPEWALDAKESTMAIKVAADHMLGLVNDLLDLSKLVANRMTLALEDQIIEPIVEQVHMMLASKASERQLKFELEAVGNIERMETEAKALRQILVNLISNAIKFTEPGGTVRLEWGEEGEDCVRFSVQDTGSGVAPEQLARMFEEFVQIEDEHGRARAGTGLGLALVSQLVAVHGGTIDVESELGVGTTFTIMLPRNFSASGPLPGAEEEE